MLIEPASNVSVPLTVVMRTRSRVPERALLPPHVLKPPLLAGTVVWPKVPDATQAFVEEFCKNKLVVPETIPAAKLSAVTRKPVVALTFTLFAVYEAESYPVVATLPEPI